MRTKLPIPTHRKCSICKKTKPVKLFTWQMSAGRMWPKNRCKKCVSGTPYNRMKGREYYKARRLKMLEYLSSHPCVDCGEKDPIILEFDHRDPKTKIMAVGTMFALNRPWNKIMQEVDKCDVRCANCHKRKTALTRGYFSVSFLKSTSSPSLNVSDKG
jgi:hypothetical protein